MPLSLRHAERKIAALQAHASQLADWDGAHSAYAAMRCMASAARANRVPCCFAEAFTSVRLAAPARRAGAPRTTTTRVQTSAQAGVVWLARSVQLAMARLGNGVKIR